MTKPCNCIGVESEFISKLFGKNPIIVLNGPNDTKEAIAKVLGSFNPKEQTSSDISVDRVTKYVAVARRIARYDLTNDSVSAHDALVLLSRHARLKYGTNYSARQAIEDASHFGVYKVKESEVVKQEQQSSSDDQPLPVFAAALSQLYFLLTGRQLDERKALWITRDGDIHVYEFANIGLTVNSEGYLYATLGLEEKLFDAVLAHLGRANEIPEKPKEPETWDDKSRSDYNSAWSDYRDNYPILTLYDVQSYLNILQNQPSHCPCPPGE